MPPLMALTATVWTGQTIELMTSDSSAVMSHFHSTPGGAVGSLRVQPTRACVPTIGTTHTGGVPAAARRDGQGTSVSTGQYVGALGQRGIGAEAGPARIRRDRDRGRLVTATDDGQTLIPTFQLNDDFEHNRLTGEATSALLDSGYSPWDIWDWAETANPWIGRRRPVETIRTGDAEAVRRAIAAAAGEGPGAERHASTNP